MSRLDETVTEPAAYVLPLHRADDDSGWASADWRLRRGRIVLLDGRLTGRAEAAAEVDQLGAAAADPHRRPLGAPRAAARRTRHRRRGSRGRRRDADHRDRGRGPRRVAVHLPAADRATPSTSSTWSRRVEAAAAKADCPIVLEGYGPPPDPRISSMTVTPDPGVIEVNVAPTTGFADQRQAAGNPLRGGPAGAAFAPSRSTSTAPTAVPAAATTSPWAASPPPIRRCCAVPTCWCRC